MDDLTPVTNRMRAAGLQHFLNVAFRNFMARQGDIGRIAFTGQPTAGQADNQAFDGNASHAFRSIDCQTNGLLGAIKINNNAGLDAARLLVPDAKHFNGMGPARQDIDTFQRTQAGNQTAHLA